MNKDSKNNYLKERVDYGLKLYTPRTNLFDLAWERFGSTGIYCGFS